MKGKVNRTEGTYQVEACPGQGSKSGQSSQIGLRHVFEKFQNGGIVQENQKGDLFLQDKAPKTRNIKKGHFHLF